MATVPVEGFTAYYNTRGPYMPHMSTVAIVGAGDVAGAVAQALASRDAAHRVLLVDANQGAAAGKALDIRQTGAVDRFHTALDGTSDESRLIECDACVVADRFGVAGDWRGEDGLSMVVRIASYLGDAPIVFAGASQVDLLGRVASETAVGRTRLIGSSAEALVSAIRAIVAMEAGCSPREVMLTVLGTPPTGFVVPWGEASIGGYAMPRVLSQVQLGRIEARAARLWPPGPYALGAAAAAVVTAILSSSRKSFSVLIQLGGEFGVKGRVGAIPARLDPRGIVETRVPELDARQQVQLQVALGSQRG
jgi:malate dehydrogenase